MLRSLLRRKAKSPISTSPSLPDPVRDAITATVGIKALPPMPAAAQKAFELATNPAADIRDFVELIERDEGLSARVIKIANSVYFDRGSGSTTIEESVTKIGVNEVRALLHAGSLSEFFPSRHPLRGNLWTHDIGVAIIAKRIAQEECPAFVEAAFSAGLLHDIGKLLLLQRLGDDYAKLLTASGSTGRPLFEMEGEKYLWDHTEVGHYIAERWSFGPDVTAVIRSHHRPLGEGPLTDLVEVVACADCLAHILEIGHSRGYAPPRRVFEDTLQAVWRKLNVAPGDERERLASFRRGYEDEAELYVSG